MEVPHGCRQWPLLGVLLLSSAPALAQERSAVPNSTESVVSAVDVALTHRVIEADGTPSMPIATEVAFTLQKLRTRSGATKIRLTYRTPVPSERTQGQRHPLDGARVEYDPDAQSATVFDEAGQRANPRLSLSSSARLGSFDTWLDTLVFRSTDASARREALEQSYGRPAGRVGRLTRHVRTSGDTSEELLVDSTSALPVELNLRRQNALEGHVTIDYDVRPDGHLVRRRLRSEQVIDARSARRSVLSIEFSNVAAEGW
jgi:hypothetical protein